MPDPPVTAAQTDQPRAFSDDRIRELWRSVSGPYAELTGPLIRFANLCRAEQAATDTARIETLEREAATCRGTNPFAGNPQEWGHVAMIQGLVEQRDAAEQARDALWRPRVMAEMNRYRKKPVVIEAARWWKNGDHTEDYTEDRQVIENGVLGMKPGSFFREHDWEGGVVRYFRHPAVSGEKPCEHCGVRMHEHGWIDTLEGGHIVCPGDWIITGVKGERYPCKPDIFEATYDPA